MSPIADVDVGTRTVVLLLVLLMGGVSAAFGAGARLMTALSITSIAVATLAFIGLHVAHHLPSAPDPSDTPSDPASRSSV